MTKPANQNAKTPAATQPGTAAASSGKGAAPTGETAASQPSPKSWSEIRVGSLVIAQEGLEEV